MGENIKLLYSIICDDVRVEIGNKLSLMGLFQNIFVNAFPAVHSKFFIVNQWGKGCGKFVSSIIIREPQGVEILKMQGAQFELKDENTWHTDIVNVSNLKLPNPGIYMVELYINGQLFEKNKFMCVKVKTDL